MRGKICFLNDAFNDYHNQISIQAGFHASEKCNDGTYHRLRGMSACSRQQEKDESKEEIDLLLDFPYIIYIGNTIRTYFIGFAAMVSWYRLNIYPLFSVVPL